MEHDGVSQFKRGSRFAAEGVVIVGSILLALAADAWLEERSDREQERIEIEGLREQLEANRESLVLAIELDERGSDNTRFLINTLEAAESAGTVPVSDSVIGLIGSSTFFDPPVARFESIIASGRLSLIRDDYLRAAVADWPNVARRPQFPANSRREMFRNQLVPYLIANHDVDDWLNTGPTGRTIHVVIDPTLINLLKTRVWFDQIIVEEQREVLALLDQLLEQIEVAAHEAA
jgi:hypothetical protein